MTARSDGSPAAPYALHNQLTPYLLISRREAQRLRRQTAGLLTLRVSDQLVGVVLLHVLCEVPYHPIQATLVNKWTPSQEALQEGVPALRKPCGALVKRFHPTADGQRP